MKTSELVEDNLYLYSSRRLEYVELLRFKEKSTFHHTGSQSYYGYTFESTESNCLIRLDSYDIQYSIVSACKIQVAFYGLEWPNEA